MQRLELRTLSLSQFSDFVKIKIKSYFSIKRSNDQVLFCMETVPFSVRKIVSRIDVIK